MKRVNSKTLRKRWENERWKKWPKEPDNPKRNQSVKHKKALQDWWTNELDNIEPAPWSEHFNEHKANWDFKRWAKQRLKEK